MKKEFMVVLTKNATKDQFDAFLLKYDIDIAIDFEALERHYAILFDETKKAAIKADPIVHHVTEADAPVKLMAVQNIRVEATGYGGNWGLTRICHRDDWNDNTWYPNEGDYTYYRTGKDVDVYIVDTGARLSHQDFAGRISVIYDHYRQPTDPAYGVDQQGHGTHVASTVAGTKYGVAKEAQILVSRVFETGGATLSAIIAGINACVAHHKNKKATGSNRPSVMNLSLGGPAHIIEEQAINDCIDNGIVCVAAAGNDGKDLSEANYDVMPAEIARAITVGSVDIQDRISSFSNYGWQVDVFAPGHYITAAGYDADDGAMMLSGTSMASPHVAGICALYLEGFGITQSGAHVMEVHDWIWRNSTQNTLSLTESATTAETSNRFVFSDFIVADEPTPEPTPQPIIEVDRITENIITADESRSDPVTVTTYVDVTESIIEENGSTVTTITRNYTDTTTVIVTITTSTTIMTTVTYSDGTTDIQYSEPTVITTTEEEISVATRSEIISTTTTPAPAPEPTPTKGKKKGWWKKSRPWSRTRGGRFAYYRLKRIENMYNRVEQNDTIETLLSELEDIASELSGLRRRARIIIAQKFLRQYMKIIYLIRHNR